MQLHFCLVFVFLPLACAKVVKCRNDNSTCLVVKPKLSTTSVLSTNCIIKNFRTKIEKEGCLLKWSCSPKFSVSELRGFSLRLSLEAPWNDVHFSVTDADVNTTFQYLVNSIQGTFEATIMPIPTDAINPNKYKSNTVECNRFIEDAIVASEDITSHMSLVKDKVLADIPQLNPYALTVTFPPVPARYRSRIRGYSVMLTCTQELEILVRCKTDPLLSESNSKSAPCVQRYFKEETIGRVVEGYNVFFPVVHPGFYYVSVEPYMNASKDAANCKVSDLSPQPCQESNYVVFAADFHCNRHGDRLACNMYLGQQRTTPFVGVFLVSFEPLSPRLQVQNFTTSQRVGNVLVCNVIGRSQELILRNCVDKTENWLKTCADKGFSINSVNPFDILPTLDAPIEDIVLTLDIPSEDVVPTLDVLSANVVPILDVQREEGVPVYAWIIIVFAVTAVSLFIIGLYIQLRKNKKLFLAIVDFRAQTATVVLPAGDSIGHIRPSYFKPGEIQANDVQQKWRKFDKMLCVFSRPAQMYDFVDGKTQGHVAQIFSSIRKQAADRLLIAVYDHLDASLSKSTTNSLQIFFLPRDSASLLQSLAVHTEDTDFLEPLIPHPECIADPHLNVALDADLYESMVNGNTPTW